MENKVIFARNLKNLMDANQISRRDLSEALNISYHTITDWVKGKKYPRMDKVEILANYFKPQFTDSVEKYERYGTQYVISWGRSVLGADTALVELPYYIREYFMIEKL